MPTSRYADDPIDDPDPPITAPRYPEGGVLGGSDMGAGMMTEPFIPPASEGGEGSSNRTRYGLGAGGGGDPLDNAVSADDIEPLAKAVEQTESGGRTRAVSRKGARGVMQIMPATARAYGVHPDSLFKPEVNRALGRKILAENLQRYGGDKRKALWAYNAGHGAVAEGRMPQETSSYIDKVLGLLSPSEASAAEDDPLAKATQQPAEEDPLAAATDLTPGKTEKALPPSAGSVFSRPQTAGEELKSAAKTGAELGVGVGLPVAAGMALGPEASVPVKVGVQALAGAVQPFAEAGVAKLMGEHPDMPTWRDAAKSAAFNAGLTSVGEGLGMLGGKAAAIRPEMEVFPGPQSRQTVKQAVRNRDFWKQHGLDDASIDHILASPDAQAREAERIEAGMKTKQAFQTVVDNTRDNFHARYTGVLGKEAEAPVNVGAVSQAFQTLSEGAGQHELTPSFRNFLARKAEELDPAIKYRGSSPVSTSSSMSAQQIDPSAPASTIKGRGQPRPAIGAKPLTVEDAQKLRTELRENTPRGATPLDKQAAAQLNQLLTDEIERPLSIEQRAGMKAVDAEYGRYSQMLDRLDPRSERYGHDIANALFDPMVKNSGDALKFINLAEQAEKARPGEVMSQLREAFQQKMLEEGHVPGQPFEELRALRKLQDTWGTKKDARAVMASLFGRDSPMANPATFAKTLGYADNPRSVIDAVGAKPGKFRSILSSPYMQTYALSGAIMAASGVRGGNLWTSVTGQKGPAAQLIAVSSMILSPLLIGKVINSGNRKLQESMVNFMTKPEPANMLRYMGELSGATAGGLVSLPNETTNQPHS